MVPILRLLQSAAAMAVWSRVKSMPLSVTDWLAGAGVRVALPAQRRVERRREGRRIGLGRELLQVDVHLGRDRGRHVRIGKHGREIAPRHVIAADLVIEDAELELDARRVGRVDEHALERRDGAFVVADLRGKLRITVSEIEIVRTGDHLPEQRLALRIDVGGAETFHGGAGTGIGAAREGVCPPMTRHAAIATAIASVVHPLITRPFCALRKANCGRPWAKAPPCRGR